MSNAYINYYLNQAGSGLSAFEGVRYQRGNGFFGRLLSGAILPALRFLGRKALSTGVDVEFDLFSVPSTQYSIERDVVTEHRSLTKLSMNSCIDFHFVTNEDEYVKLRESLLFVKFRVKIAKSDGKDVTDEDWTKVVPIVNLLHSMFKQVDLEINAVNVIATPQNYAYRAYFDTLCGFSDGAKSSFLQAVGTPYTQLSPPPGSVNKSEGRIIELMGLLHVDLALQARALVGSLQYKMQFTLHSPEFFLKINDENIKPTVELLDAALFIHRARVIPPLLEAHTLALRTATAKYPITRSEVRTHTLSNGVRDALIDNFVLGQLPRRAILGLVDNDAFIGVAGKDPLKFEHFNVNHIAVYLDGVQFPSRPYTPDFANDSFYREYLGLYQTLNQISPDPTFTLTPEKYKEGDILFGFNFAPDLSDGCGVIGHLNPIRRGSLRVDLKFKRPLPNSITVVLYCEFDNLIEINSERQVSTDFRNGHLSAQ
ncbi:uncharacterized protein F54H12.2-like [Brevipalpus obovatus]|uniref:uncharacterized protein F54H12.2-like n=1 Tax=Brevipalpus obovatus TaxID=246614 RepID=UPI003D9EAF19